MATKKGNRAAEAQPIQGESIRYSGLALAVDSPFRVEDGLPLGGGLKEAEHLLNAAYELLRVLESQAEDPSLKGVMFLVNSAGALVSSLWRGFNNHALSREPDGYHADPRTMKSPVIEARGGA